MKGKDGKGKDGFRNPHNLPVKTCVVCNRPFTWRKKWENCWDEVTTCSKACNAARKKAKRASSEDLSDAERDGAELDPKAARKASKKAAKANRRAVRMGMSGAGDKPCDLCATSVDLLIRCQIDSG